MFAEWLAWKPARIKSTATRFPQSKSEEGIHRKGPPAILQAYLEGCNQACTCVQRIGAPRNVAYRFAE